MFTKYPKERTIIGYCCIQLKNCIKHVYISNLASFSERQAKHQTFEESEFRFSVELGLVVKADQYMQGVSFVMWKTCYLGFPLAAEQEECSAKTIFISLICSPQKGSGMWWLILLAC